MSSSLFLHKNECNEKIWDTNDLLNPEFPTQKNHEKQAPLKCNQLILMSPTSPLPHSPSHVVYYLHLPKLSSSLSPYIDHYLETQTDSCSWYVSLSSISILSEGCFPLVSRFGHPSCTNSSEEVCSSGGTVTTTASKLPVYVLVYDPPYQILHP